MLRKLLTLIAVLNGLMLGVDARATVPGAGVGMSQPAQQSEMAATQAVAAAPARNWDAPHIWVAAPLPAPARAMVPAYRLRVDRAHE